MCVCAQVQRSSVGLGSCGRVIISSSSNHPDIMSGPAAMVKATPRTARKTRAGPVPSPFAKDKDSINSSKLLTPGNRCVLRLDGGHPRLDRKLSMFGHSGDDDGTTTSKGPRSYPRGPLGFRNGTDRVCSLLQLTFSSHHTSHAPSVPLRINLCDDVDNTIVTTRPTG